MSARQRQKMITRAWRRGRLHTQEAKDRISSTKKRIGPSNALIEAARRNGLANQGRKASPTTVAKLSAAQMRRFASNPGSHPMRGRKQSEETRRKMSAHWQKEKERGSDIWKKHGQFMKQYFQSHPEKHPNYVLGKNGHVSKGQYTLYLETKRIYPDAELNFPIKTSSGHLYFADVCIPSLKEIIEYDGWYWHKDTERDKLRDYNLQLDGWKVRHVLEDRRARRAAAQKELQRLLAERSAVD